MYSDEYCHCLVKQQEVTLKEKGLKAFFMLLYFKTLTKCTIKNIFVKDPTCFSRLPSSEIISTIGMTCSLYNTH